MTETTVSILVGPDKADTFLTLFHNIKAFSTSIVLLLEPERLYLQTMDPSHVSVVELVLPAAWFSGFQVDKPTRIGFDVVLFSKILATRDKAAKQSLCLELAGNGDELFISMPCPLNEGESQLIQKKFQMPLIDLDQDLLGIPESESDAEFTVLSTDWAEWISQLRLFSDQVDMQCSEDSILLKSKSKDKGGMTAKIDIDKLIGFSINEGETIHQCFSGTYMGHISQFHKLAQTTTVRVQSGNPLQVEYVLSADVGGTMRFYLAPKIGDDEEED
jgi:proliferating cell nuclear antigen PCNA